MTSTTDELAPTAASEAEPSVTTIPALDGVRAIGIVLVLLFHGGINWIGGGFFGVDVFFVLSGFLITGLLVAEFRRDHTIRLLRFWGHRVRRLLPALLAMLLAVSAYVLLFAPADTVSQIRDDAVWTLLYGNNWHLIAGSQGYFAGLAAPRPLLHTWSLSIEEQFYVIWPLVVLGVLRISRSRAALLTVSIGGAIASAVVMALAYGGGSGVDRAYYGTDSRAQAVLIGASLAILLAEPLTTRRSTSTNPTRIVRSVPLGHGASSAVAGLGVASLIAIFLLSSFCESTSGWIYDGGFALVALVTAGLITSVSLVQRGPAARLLSMRPVRYVGAISYGLYLWHWPIFVLLTRDRTGLAGLALLGVRLAVTTAVSVISYRFLEMPIRRRRLKGWRGWLAAPLAFGATMAVVLAVTAGAIPSMSSGVAVKAPTEAAPKTFVEQGTGANVPIRQPGGGTGPIRLLLLGDSEASFLAFGLGPSSEAHGIDFAGDGIMGCGFVHSPTILAGRLEPGVAGQRPGQDYVVPCATQEQRWKADVEAFKPDVVVVFNGAYDVRDHKINGRWMHLGQPELDRRLSAAIRSSIRLLGSQGATVALLTAPYYQQPERSDGSRWPEDDPARVDTYNRIIRQLVAEAPMTTKVIDVHRKLDPRNRYTQRIDGVTVRYSDGIHVTPQGARLIGPWLLDQVARIGKASRAGIASREGN